MCETKPVDASPAIHAAASNQLAVVRKEQVASAWVVKVIGLGRDNPCMSGVDATLVGNHPPSSSN